MADTAKITVLPSMEHTFTLSVTGAETKQVFDGTFTYKRLTLGQRLEVNKMEARLRENILQQNLAIDVNLYVEMISYLRYGLIKFPDWWKNTNFGIDIYDINVITQLYTACDTFEKDWDKQVKGE